MILVLGKEHATQTLGEIVSAVERLGWTTSVSQGDEQIVVGLSGSGEVEALEALLRQRGDVDVVPILSDREYRHLRTRRRLMTGLVAGLGLLTAAAGGAPLVGFLLPPKGTLTDRNLISAGPKDEIPELSAVRLMLLGHPVLLVRLEQDRFYALSAICTHMSVCQLEWKSERRQLVCPCHGGAFDVHGNVVQGPPSVPLNRYGIEEIRGELFVRGEG